MRTAVKRIVLAVLYVFVLPCGLAARLGLWLRSILLFEHLAQAFALLPGKCGCLARSCYYHQTLEASHLDACFQFGSLVSKPGTRVERGVYVGLWSAIGLADIAEGAVIGNRVGILSGRHQHDLSDPGRSPMSGVDSFTRVRIGRNAFVGDNAVVMADIGQGTVVGAGAVVVEALPANVIAVGNPARVVKQRSSDEA
jgi:virginiamycin A acetyltransferase